MSVLASQQPVETAFGDDTNRLGPSVSPSPPCIYCGGVQYRPLFTEIRDRLGFVQGVWSFEHCDACEAALLVPRPTSAELGNYYPDIYTFAPQVAQRSPGHRLLASAEYHALYGPMYRSQARQIAGLSGGAPGTTLLDIGCGRGLRLLELRRRGFDVQGVDFDPAAVEYLRQTHGIPAVACDVLTIADRFAAESFDTIAAYYVLEHVVELDRLLRSAYELLRPGGSFIAAVPLVSGLQSKWLGDRWCQVTEAPRHVSLPSARSMEIALRNAGFVDVRLESDSYLLSASSVALSVVSRGTTHAAYGRSALSGIANRLLAIATAAASLPLSVWEDRIARRPSLGVFAARRPGSA